MSTKRVVPNKCCRTRVEIEGCAYRTVSFFHDHPSKIPEEGWSVFEHESGPIIVDQLTLAVMSECRCEFLTRDVDKLSDQPTIVAVELAPVVVSINK